jgi:hypothetical protein
LFEETIAEVLPAVGDTQKHDANLISAAPELLESLTQLLHLYRGQVTNNGDYYPVLMDRAQMAINKALGKED